MTTLPRPQIFLIDGYAVIYRAFFAMIARPLTTSRGENTSAAWGVANFLLRLRKEYQPDYLVWIHDAGTSFRKETYPEYKATREKLDDELQDTFDRSVERIEELLTAFRTPPVKMCSSIFRRSRWMVSRPWQRVRRLSLKLRPATRGFTLPA